jgi:quercetin dioxygenase-like cupin family protein
MTRASKLAVAAILCFGFGASGALAQEQVERKQLQSSEWPVGYNTTTITATFKANGFLPRHTHPGVENGYLLEGEAVLKIDGKADLTLKPGDSWIVPANTPHSATAGATGAKVLVTYVIDKTKPFASPAP